MKHQISEVLLLTSCGVRLIVVLMILIVVLLLIGIIQGCFGSREILCASGAFLLCALNIYQLKSVAGGPAKSAS